MTRPENKIFTLSRASSPFTHFNLPSIFRFLCSRSVLFFLLYFAHPIRPFQLSAATNVFTPWPGELLKVPSAKEYRLFYLRKKK
jgi:hypothetical protein